MINEGKSEPIEKNLFDLLVGSEEPSQKLRTPFSVELVDDVHHVSAMGYSSPRLLPA